MQLIIEFSRERCGDSAFIHWVLMGAHEDDLDKVVVGYAPTRELYAAMCETMGVQASEEGFRERQQRCVVEDRAILIEEVFRAKGDALRNILEQIKPQFEAWIAVCQEAGAEDVKFQMDCTLGPA